MYTPGKPQAFGCARILVAGLLAAVSAGGCQTAEGTGALAGGAVGAGVGGLLSHCPGGAVLGGLIGAGTGAIAGAAVDANNAKKAANAAAADAAVRAPTLDEVARMTQSGVQPGIIIEQIRTSGMVYRLTPDQVVWLTQQGVNPSVVQAMQDSAYRPRYYGRGMVYGPPPVAVYEPGPVVGVGVGVGPGWR
jgi:hypothetical protein